MNKNLRERYDERYSPILRAFLNEVVEENAEGIPEVHLPLYGVNYESSKIKIVFVGMETFGWGCMSAFLTDVKTDAQKAIHRNQFEFDSLEFTKWTNNFGKTFWDTVLKILAKIYSVGDPKKLKNREFPDILKSFAWSETNSLERFHLTAKGKGADHKSWIKIKHASEKYFDHLQLILDVLTPNIVIIMHWSVTNEYLGRDLQWQSLGNHLVYAWNEEHKVKIFKAAHPGWLGRKRLLEHTIEVIAANCEQPI